MAEGININEEDVQKENVPDDLNSLAVGSYVIPNPLRRRRFANLVLLSSIIAFSLNFILELGNLIPSSIILGITSLFIYSIDNKITLNQHEILEFLTDKITHSIGYYSIALTFEFKLKLRFLNPVWTVIVYDHKNPPSLKSILEIDAFKLILIGDIYTEEIIDA
tara:strand:- start:923 stop:1414 length:492 start_codon:yes stop_codon:yes gene_type:complete